MAKFTHLHTHSHYSLLDGLAKIDNLIARTKELGMDSIALTDHGNLYGAIEFYKKAKAAGIKPILGMEAYIAPGDHRDKTIAGEDRYYHLILLCKNETGWRNLIALTTKAHLEGFYYKPRMSKALLREHHEGLIALSACLSGEISRNLLAGHADTAEKTALEYQDIFGAGNFYIEIGNHPGIKETLKVHPKLVALAKKTGIPLVATQDIHYLKKEDAQYHDILLAVQTGNKISDSDRLTLKDDDFSLRSPDEMAALFPDAPEAVTNTVKISEQCNVAIELGKIRLPKFPLPAGEISARDYLRKLINEKAPKRFAAITPDITNRIEYELGVIEKMNFADYFLIVQDFINWAKDRGIVVGPGRGSAAGSIISYILAITDVDPIKYDLLFERFLNPDRIQMPDIDVDITDRRRDEVFGYLQEKYGQDRVAHIITFGTMAARASIRDVGRALGVSLEFCDQLAKLIPFNPTQGMKEGWIDECLAQVAELKTLYETNEDAKRIIDAAKQMEGVARHASVHACGTVITGEPLTTYLPLQFAPQDDKVIITQFEMHGVEDLGLLKMDLLGLKNLTILEDTVRLVAEHKNETVDIAKLPEKDPKTFAALQTGDTTGVFQFESSGMRRYMKELKPTDLEDLIALVALYRPGPMELIPSYIKRKHGQERVTYLHPRLEKHLKNTYGVGVYQEQMMSIARDLAGFSLAQADTLRKAIGKKIKSLLDEQQEKIIKGMLAGGIDPKTATAIWELFPPFARYGFNRSHAVCYATIGYQTAYLKSHYPVEFMTSLMNSDSGDVERVAFLISEAKRMGIKVFAPDINKSAATFIPEGTGIRFGLTAIKNVGNNIIQAIIEERQRGGEFDNFGAFINRVQHKDLNKKSLESLIKSGALDSFNIERATTLANIDDIVKFSGLLKKESRSQQTGLFGSAAVGQKLKLKPAPPATPEEKLTWEKELLGLYISDHPLNSHREKLAATKARPIKELLTIAQNPSAYYTPFSGSPLNGKTQIAGIVSKVNRIITKNGKPMAFVKIEDFTDAMEVLVFAETLEKTAQHWQENNIVLVTGKTSTRDGETKFICDSAKTLL